MARCDPWGPPTLLLHARVADVTSVDADACGGRGGGGGGSGDDDLEGVALVAFLCYREDGKFVA